MRTLSLKIFLDDGKKITDLAISKWNVPDSIPMLGEDATPAEEADIARDTLRCFLNQVVDDLVALPHLEWDETKGETADNVYPEYKKAVKMRRELQERVFSKLIAALRNKKEG